MKKLISAILAVALAASLTACGKKYEPIPFESYQELINAVRTSQEITDFEAVSDKESDTAKSIFAMTGIAAEDIEEFSAACSFMNVSAYCVGIFKPAAGKAAAVEAALKEYAVLQQKNMENYLPDQYEIAKAAKIGTAKSGEVVIVMGESSDERYEKIMASLV